ncbi:MAG: NAD(P)H-binding protein, partial [Deltaproteobacteria bacterium]|nr:NAD(P)H-binding protein [Deltaproteobacteria bacterium]
MTSRPVFVTGATGNVGRAVVDALVARGVPVRVGDRAPERLAPRAGTEAVRFDFADPTTFSAAVGCGAAFVLRPPAISKVKPTLNAFVDAARA